MYLARINDDWRAFVQVDQEQVPEVLDLVLGEALEVFSKPAKTASD
jgi:hypothetical protein